jgi:hypothetical protein
MRSCIYLSILMVSGAANAQQSSATGRITDRDLGRIYEGMNAEPRMNVERRECLVRKTTGKSECRTRYEWRRMAAQMKIKPNNGQ